VLSSSDLVVGRSDESDVFLDDVTVSRRHAVIVRGADGWSISDDGSLNGTYVNRRLAEGSVALASGDEVQLGKYRFVFVEASRS
jgi:pSer/pThr/pTyr-binding forkhead associated (FHA) protein